MKFILLMATFLIANLFAVETVKSVECSQGDCKTNAPKTSSTRVDTNGNLQLSDTDVLSATVVSDPSVLKSNKTLVISVTGQGVSPVNTTSPAQAYALAKRAAIADGYRLIAEKIKGVKVDGQDTIKNMMVTRSTVRTYVQAMVKNANIVETNFKDGLCEVEMEVVLSYTDFSI